MTIKIATFADFHLGVKTYGIVDSKTGLNTREINALKSLDIMIDYCIDNNIKYILGAGDMFKNNLPSPTIQNEFDKRIHRASSNGIILYLMSGNHDVSSLGTAKSPLETYKTLKVNNVYHSRFTEEYYINDNLRILMLPTYCNQTEIENILDNYQKDVPTIVVGHSTILGAKLNDWLLEQNENAVDCKIFERPGIIAVVLGHLHKYQILNTCPLTYYTGSLQRIDFSEELQEKGFVVLEIDDKKVDYKFIEVSSQKFHTINLDLTSIEDEMTHITKIIENDKMKINGSIVRLSMDVKKNNNINDSIIIKQLKEHNVESIASIQKNVNRDESIRNKDINETITEEKALDIYLKDNDNKNEIMKLGLEIVNKLKNDNLI